MTGRFPPEKTFVATDGRRSANGTFRPIAVVRRRDDGEGRAIVENAFAGHNTCGEGCCQRATFSDFSGECRPICGKSLLLICNFPGNIRNSGSGIADVP